MENYDGFDPQRQRTATSMRSPDLQIYASGPHREGASSNKEIETESGEVHQEKKKKKEITEAMKAHLATIRVNALKVNQEKRITRKTISGTVTAKGRSGGFGTRSLGATRS